MADRCTDMPPPCTPPSYYVTIKDLAIYVGLIKKKDKEIDENCAERTR
jgi:hypothetical protein